MVLLFFLRHSFSILSSVLLVRHAIPTESILPANAASLSKPMYTGMLNL